MNTDKMGRKYRLHMERAMSARTHMFTRYHLRKANKIWMAAWTSGWPIHPEAWGL